MKSIILAAAAIGGAIVLAAPAEARQGCGPGFHRAPDGRCFPNRGGYRPGPGGALVVGTYYPGRGYWYGNRYWRQRYRHHGGWRYR